MRIVNNALGILRVGGRWSEQFPRFLHGHSPPQAASNVWRSAPRPAPGGGVAHVGRPAAAFRNVTAEQAIERGIMFAGNPDTVFRQVMEFYDRVGGFEHLILMGRSGFMTHAEAERGIKLFAREVLPRLKEVVHHREDL